MVLAWLTGDSTPTSILTTTSNSITKGSFDDTINEEEAAALASLPRTLSSALRPSTQVIYHVYCYLFLFCFVTSLPMTLIHLSIRHVSYPLPALLHFLVFPLSTGSCHHWKCSSLPYHPRQRCLGRSLWIYQTRSSGEDFGNVTGSRYNLSHRHTHSLSRNWQTHIHIFNMCASITHPPTHTLVTFVSIDLLTSLLNVSLLFFDCIYSLSLSLVLSRSATDVSALMRLGDDIMSHQEISIELTNYTKVCSYNNQSINQCANKQTNKPTNHQN